MSKALQVTNTCLLVGIAVLVFTVPRMNFKEYERRISTLEDAWDSTRTRIRALIEELSAQKVALAQDLNKLRGVAAPSVDSAGANVRDDEVPPDEEPEGITAELTPDLQWYSDEILSKDPGSWYDFKQQALACGFFPSGQLPPELWSALRRRFEAHRIQSAVATAEYTNNLNRLKDAARAEGDYREFPMESSREEISAGLRGWKTPGVTTQERFDGVIRYFKFSYEDHPGLQGFHSGIKERHEQLISDMAQILGQ